MAFIATLNGAVTTAPGTVDFDVSYFDNVTGWSLRKTLHLPLDPALTGAQLRAAVQAAAIADATLYKSANAAAALLQTLVGTQITIS